MSRKPLRTDANLTGVVAVFDLAAFRDAVWEVLERWDMTGAELARQTGLNPSQVAGFLRSGVGLGLGYVTALAWYCDLSLDPFIRPTLRVAS